MAGSSKIDPGKLDPSVVAKFEVDNKRLRDEIMMLMDDLDNEKENVKNLKIQRKEMQIELEKYK